MSKQTEGLTKALQTERQKRQLAEEKIRKLELALSSAPSFWKKRDQRISAENIFDGLLFLSVKGNKKAKSIINEFTEESISEGLEIYIRESDFENHLFSTDEILSQGVKIAEEFLLETEEPHWVKLTKKVAEETGLEAIIPPIDNRQRWIK